MLDFTKLFYEKQELETPNGFFSSITTMVGNMFVPEEGGEDDEILKPSDAVLLAFYEVVHLNSNFITLLTNSQTDCFAISSTASSASSSSSTSDDNKLQNMPSNLLVTFFEFCSIVMLQTRGRIIKECKLRFKDTKSS